MRINETRPTRKEDEEWFESTGLYEYGQGCRYKEMLWVKSVHYGKWTPLSNVNFVLLTADSPDTGTGKISVEEHECRTWLERHSLSYNRPGHGLVSVDEHLMNIFMSVDTDNWFEWLTASLSPRPTLMTGPYILIHLVSIWTWPYAIIYGSRVNFHEVPLAIGREDTWYKLPTSGNPMGPGRATLRVAPPKNRSTAKNIDWGHSVPPITALKTAMPVITVTVLSTEIAEVWSCRWPNGAEKVWLLLKA